MTSRFAVSLASKKLNHYPPTIEDANLNILEKFVINMYDKNITTGKVEAERLDLFPLK